jgi:hypothetical protein
MVFAKKLKGIDQQPAQLTRRQFFGRTSFAILPIDLWFRRIQMKLSLHTTKQLRRTQAER